MSDSSSIHGQNNEQSSDSDEGINASGLFINQKSLLNNFHGLKRDAMERNGSDQKMSDDIEENNRNGGPSSNHNQGGKEQRDLQGDEDNAYSSQEHNHDQNNDQEMQEEQSDNSSPKNDEGEAELDEEQEADEEEQGEDEEDDDFNFGNEKNGNQHLQLPPVDSEDREENNDDFVDHEDHMMVSENQPDIVVIQATEAIIRQEAAIISPQYSQKLSSSHVSSQRSLQVGQQFLQVHGAGIVSEVAKELGIPVTSQNSRPLGTPPKGSPSKILSQVLASQRSASKHQSPVKPVVVEDRESSSQIQEEQMEESSVSLANQFEVISSSEVREAINEAGDANEEEGEEEGEDQEESEQEVESESSESIHRYYTALDHQFPTFGRYTAGKSEAIPHSKFQVRQWKDIKKSPSRTTGGLGLMNNDEDEVEVPVPQAQIEEVKENSSSLHTDQSMKETSVDIIIPPLPESKKSSTQKTVVKESVKKATTLEIVPEKKTPRAASKPTTASKKSVQKEATTIKSAKKSSQKKQPQADEELKEEVVVIQKVQDVTIPEIKGFIQHSPIDSQEIKPKSSRKQSPVKKIIEKRAPSARKESPKKEVEKGISTRNAEIKKSASPIKAPAKTPVNTPAPIKIESVLKKAELTPKKSAVKDKLPSKRTRSPEPAQQSPIKKKQEIISQKKQIVAPKVLETPRSSQRTIAQKESKKDVSPAKQSPQKASEKKAPLAKKSVTPIKQSPQRKRDVKASEKVQKKEEKHIIAPSPKKVEVKQQAKQSKPSAALAALDLGLIVNTPRQVIPPTKYTPGPSQIRSYYQSILEKKEETVAPVTSRSHTQTTTIGKQAPPRDKSPVKKQAPAPIKKAMSPEKTKKVVPVVTPTPLTKKRDAKGKRKEEDKKVKKDTTRDKSPAPPAKKVEKKPAIKAKPQAAEPPKKPEAKTQAKVVKKDDKKKLIQAPKVAPKQAKTSPKKQEKVVKKPVSKSSKKPEKKADNNSNKKSKAAKKPAPAVGAKRPAPTKVAKLEKKVVLKKKPAPSCNKKPKRK